MELCICADGPDLDSFVDQVFGRCKYLLFLDRQGKGLDSVKNKAGLSERGAGIATAQMIVDKGVEIVIVGNIGPNALTALQKSGARVVSGISGRAREVLEKFKNGRI